MENKLFKLKGGNSAEAFTRECFDRPNDKYRQNDSGWNACQYYALSFRILLLRSSLYLTI